MSGHKSFRRNRIAAFAATGFALSLAGLAAGQHAGVQQGEYHPAELGELRQAAPMPQMIGSSYAVPAYPVPALALAEGEGVQEVRIYCNTCHSPRYITMQPPLPASAWEAEVNKMNKTFGAGIPDDSTQKIIHYLQAHYAPETRKE